MPSPPHSATTFSTPPSRVTADYDAIKWELAPIAIQPHASQMEIPDAFSKSQTKEFV